MIITRDNAVWHVRAAVNRIEESERLSPPGTHDHAQFLKAALLNNWQVIRSAVRTLERELLSKKAD